MSELDGEAAKAIEVSELCVLQERQRRVVAEKLQK